MRTRMFRWSVAIAAAAFIAGVGTVTPHASAGARIVGGTNAPAASWPSIAALVVDQQPVGGQPPASGFFCGGTLIDPSWVLTAAHCVTDVNGNIVPASAFDVVLGLTNRATDVGQPRNLVQIVLHPLYVDGAFENDVALLRLQTPAVLGSTVAVMDLVSALRPDLWDAESPAQIAGWGETNTIEGVSDSLKQASITVIADATCQSSPLGFGGPPTYTPAQMLCAGVLSGGIDACQGDSGGPLSVLDGQTRVLAGLTSWGIGCAQPNIPGVYTRLDTYRGFIYGSSGLNLAPPGAPTGVTAVAGIQSATISWNAAASGGRAIQTYGVRVIQDGVPGALVPVGAGQLQTTLTNLSPGSTYTFSVLAASAVGVSPAASSNPVVPIVPAPVNVVPPTAVPVPTAVPAPSGSGAATVAGRARVGRALLANPGTWSLPADLQVIWQVCDAAGGSCADVPGATGNVFLPAAAHVGRRVRVRVVARNAGGVSEAASALTDVVLAPFVIRVVRQPRVEQRPNGSVRITLSVRVEPGARVAVKVLDAKGTHALRRLQSRINRRVPNGNGRTLVVIAPASGVIDVAIALQGAGHGTRRVGRIALTATDATGERATLVRPFRARL